MSAPDDAVLREAQLQALGALIDLPLAEELGARFSDAGHELYLVGGTVRDLLRGAGDSPDLDFATSAMPEDTAALLKGWAQHVWLTGVRFGTVSASREDVTIEITT